MDAEFIDINEAAALSGKSVQTIRRAIKLKRFSVRRKKTPQGFYYVILKKTIVDLYGGLKKIPVEPASPHTDSRMDSHTGSHTDSHMDSHMDSRTSSRMDSRETHRPRNHLHNRHGQAEFSLTKPSKNQEMQELKRAMQSVMNQYQKEREQMTLLLKDLQNRLFVMENQVRLLSAPKKKWYQFWY